jgi:hypothetical protein
MATYAVRFAPRNSISASAMWPESLLILLWDSSIRTASERLHGGRALKMSNAGMVATESRHERAVRLPQE